MQLLAMKAVLSHCVSRLFSPVSAPVLSPMQATFEFERILLPRRSAFTICDKGRLRRLRTSQHPTPHCHLPNRSIGSTRTRIHPWRAQGIYSSMGLPVGVVSSFSCRFERT